MSYDLFFYPEDPAHPPDPDALRSFFGGRPHYRLGDGSAEYENPDTGVYFTFSYYQGDLSFTINYFRAHFFALEADVEITALVRAFPLTVSDPQGYLGERYDSATFVAGWKRSNAGASAAIVDLHAPDTPTLPEADLARYWRWNYERRFYQERLGAEVLLPPVLFALHGGRAAALVAWTDGAAVALPRVDLVVLMRHHIDGAALPRPALVAWEDLAPLLEPYPAIEAPVPHRLLRYADVPSEIAAFFLAQPRFTERLPHILPDRILDRPEASDS